MLAFQSQGPVEWSCSFVVEMLAFQSQGPMEWSCSFVVEMLAFQSQGPMEWSCSFVVEMLAFQSQGPMEWSCSFVVEILAFQSQGPMEWSCSFVVEMLAFQSQGPMEWSCSFVVKMLAFQSQGPVEWSCSLVVEMLAFHSHGPGLKSYQDQDFISQLKSTTPYLSGAVDCWLRCLPSIPRVLALKSCQKPGFFLSLIMRLSLIIRNIIEHHFHPEVSSHLLLTIGNKWQWSPILYSFFLSQHFSPLSK